jgi:hypothetical protein
MGLETDETVGNNATPMQPYASGSSSTYSFLQSFPFASKFSSLYHREDMGKIRKGREVGVALSKVVGAIILHTLTSGFVIVANYKK